MPESRAAALAAFAFYAALSIIFIDHGVSLTQNILGRGSDPFAFIWFLAWWPWAISHHLNPFWTDLLWQPSGYAVLWGSSIPLLAIAAAPITLLAGPVLSFNILVLLSPVLSAWCAYVLCLRLTSAQSASLIGGLIFGFSTYQIAQAATLNLSFTFLLPCLVLAALMRFAAQIGRRRFIVQAGVMLPCEFLISTEIFAITIVFASITWLAAFALLRDERPALLAWLIEALAAMLIAFLLLSPFLAVMFSRYPFLHLPELWPYFFVADPFAFVLPSQNDLIGGGYFHRIISCYFGDFQEQDSYLGLPLLLIIHAFSRTETSRPQARFLLVVFGLLLLASLGPRLWVAGHYTGLILPWAAFMRLPLLGGALPVRFALYVALPAAIIASSWVAAPGHHPWRLRLAVLACLALWPRPYPAMPIPTSSFFQPNSVHAALGANPRILILPFAINGPSSYWQVESRFAFRQTGGYLGFPPRAMQVYPAVQELFSGDPSQLNLADFKFFLLATRTQYIVAGPGTSNGMLAAVAQLHWQTRQIDDVTIIGVPAHG